MFKKLLPLLLIAASCNSQGTSDSATNDSTTSVANTEPDITMSASQLIQNTSKDENYGTSRVGKVIKLRNVVLGGTDKLSNTEVHVWGNDGGVPSWNGNYLCCRYIFKLQNPHDADANIQGKIASITGTLSEYRDNNFTPPNANEQVTLKEYVFENVTFTLDPESPEPVQNSVESESSDNLPVDEETITNNTNGGEDENGQRSGIITSDKAYFYEDKLLSTQKKAYLVKGDKIKYFDAKEGDFNMAFYTNSAGKTTSGWILKESMK